jgi:hypothetical protein
MPPAAYKRVMPSEPDRSPPSSDAQEPGTPAPPRRSPRWRRWTIAIAAAVLAYALLGFLLAPRLLRSALQERGTAALQRRVTVADVKVNPFTLSVTVLGLEVADRDAPRLAGWSSLYVRLAPWKVLGGNLGVAEIHLIRPYARVALDAAGALNVADLLDAGDAAPAPTKEKRAPLGLALDRLEIEEAQVDFEDGSRTPSFRTTLGPMTVRLTAFRTRGGADSPYAFSGKTELGETFSWSGTLLTDPLRSSGQVTFGGLRLTKYDPYLKEQTPGLLVESGTASLETRYQLEWGAGGRRLAVSGLKIVVEDLALARRRDRSRSIALPRVEVNGGEVDVLGQVASVAEVKVLDARLTPRRDADGTMALLQMMEPPATPGGKPSTPPPPTRAGGEGAAPSGAGKSTPGWRWSVGAIAVERATVQAEDLVPPRPVRLELRDVNVRLSGLAGRPDVACPLTASLRWGDRGEASVTGTVWPFAARADLAVKADGLELSPLGPYLDGAAPLRLAQARLGVSARANVDAHGKAATWTFAGDVRLDELSLRHPAREEELVRWRSLELVGIDAASAATRASVKVVRLTEPRLRALVFEDGTTGLGDRKAPADEAARTAPATGAKAPARADAAPTWRTSIALLQLVRGRATFSDRSVQPPVLLALTDLEGRITSLSSDPRVRSRVELQAKVDGEAPVTVTGTVNPLQATAYTDLAVRAKGVDLTPLGPYAGKHLGYGLQKGKLDLELGYRVEERAIHAGNVVRIDRLTLGEATHSPDATSLPVRLALALLTDRDGLILLDVPVEGRTDDPEFRLGRVIWRAVLNVLGKIATSPFSALAALAGGGSEDLSLLEFAPGSAALDPPARKRIDVLARSLGQRPQLSLELEATADEAADARALRRAELERRLRRAKAARYHLPSDPDALEKLEILPEERAKLVEQLFAATFPAPTPPKPPAAGAPAPAPPTSAEQEGRLVEAMPLPPEELQALRAARHAAARDALVAAGVDPARLFAVQGGARPTKEGGPRVYFTVR